MTTHIKQKPGGGANAEDGGGGFGGGLNSLPKELVDPEKVWTGSGKERNVWETSVGNNH